MAQLTEIEYERLLRPHRRALRQLLMDLDFFLEDVGPINLFAVTSRLKSHTSAAQKCRERGIPLGEIQDLAGVRAVVATRHEVEMVARFFYRQQDSKDLKVESDRRISREDGYRARHLVVVYQPRYTRSVHEARIEAQLVTIFEHAFNFISRAWVYRSEKGFPVNWLADFTRLSKELKELDRLADRLHKEAVHSAASLRGNEPLTPISYQHLVREAFGEKVSLDEAVDDCRFLVDLGCGTNGEVPAFFGNQKIHEFHRRLEEAQSEADKPLARLASQLPRHNFWLTFGTRYEASIKLFGDVL